MRTSMLVHIGVAAAISAAVATSIGLVPTAGAVGESAASALVTFAPCRLVDTRAGAEHVGARAAGLGPAETATFAVRGTNGNCTIPNNATGIATNVTAVNPTATSYVTIYPADASPRPTASNLNVVAGSSPTPNQVTVGLSAAGAISAFNNGGTIDLIVDIVGYYVPASGGTQGPKGDKGDPGTPAAGTLRLSSLDLVTNATPAAYDYDASTQCVTVTATASLFLPVELPDGALITGVDVTWRDPNAATSSFITAQLFQGTPGFPSIAASNVGSSINSLSGATLTLAAGIPRVSGLATYYLQVDNTFFGGAPNNSFCSAAVSWTTA